MVKSVDHKGRVLGIMKPNKIGRHTHDSAGLFLEPVRHHFYAMNTPFRDKPGNCFAWFGIWQRGFFYFILLVFALTRFVSSTVI